MIFFFLLGIQKHILEKQTKQNTWPEPNPGSKQIDKKFVLGICQIKSSEANLPQMCPLLQYLDPKPFGGLGNIFWPISGCGPGVCLHSGVRETPVVSKS